MRAFVLAFAAIHLFCAGIVSAEGKGRGTLGVATNIEDALIYINGEKKATAGDGYTEILVNEGGYEVTVEKRSKDGKSILRGVRNVFVGEDTFVRITVNTERYPAGEDIPLAHPQTSTRAEKAGEHREIFVEERIDGLKFVLIRAGSFVMGSPIHEALRDEDERQHEVAITCEYYMQTTEVTQGVWKAVMGGNPAGFKDCGEDCPVEDVSWEDVQVFIGRLNDMLGTDTYRLPTEGEWEYACRAGTEGPFTYGECLSADQANYDGNYPMKGCPKGSNVAKPLRVASFAPNACGLYDMHGNVWEWCQDWSPKK
ncbi:formylglycine-generating enzyme family protein [Thermodesulfobacteriota bacterium]